MIELWHWPMLFVVALAAGFVDAVAGGGGLLALPALLHLGLPAPLALGTNKLQACFGSGGASWQYARGGLVSLSDCWRGMLCTALGAALGTLAVQALQPVLLRKIIPLLLLGVALLFILRPKLGDEDRPARLAPGGFDLLAGLGIGAYDGFFGPGAGTFWTMAFVVGRGFHLARATGCSKVMNFASNLVSVALFAAAGQVLLGPGLVMGLGQFLGARLGARMVLRRGARFIRPVFLAVVLAMIARLLWDAWR